MPYSRHCSWEMPVDQGFYLTGRCALWTFNKSWLDYWMDRGMDEDGWMVGWMAGWTDGWMNGWLD